MEYHLPVVSLPSLREVRFLATRHRHACTVGHSIECYFRAWARLEWSEDSTKFIKNMIPQAQKITIKGDIASISITAKDRGAVIGKGGQNIKILRELLGRNSTLKDLKLV